MIQAMKKNCPYFPSVEDAPTAGFATLLLFPLKLQMGNSANVFPTPGHV